MKIIIWGYLTYENANIFGPSTIERCAECAEMNQRRIPLVVYEYFPSTRVVIVSQRLVILHLEKKKLIITSSPSFSFK